MRWDGNGVAGLVEQDAVIADTEPEESFEVAGEGLDPARAGFSVAVDGFQNVQGGLLLDRADFFPDIGLKADFLHAASLIAFVAADLVHGEAEIGDHLLEGNACATLLEILARRGNGAAVFLGQLVIVVNHGFEQSRNSHKLRGRQLVDQLVNVLAGVVHDVISVGLLRNSIARFADDCGARAGHHLRGLE